MPRPINFFVVKDQKGSFNYAKTLTLEIVIPASKRNKVLHMREVQASLFLRRCDAANGHIEGSP
jgi:hypothetical protein